MTTTLLKTLIQRDAIAGHEAAIANLTQAIGDRFENYNREAERLEPCFYAIQNQDIATLRILIKELIEMKGRSLTISITRKPHGYLVFALGGNLDFDMFHESRSCAWKHFIYLLNHGEI